MMTGVFTFDGLFKSERDACKVYLADPMSHETLGCILNKAVQMLTDDGCDNVIFMGRGCHAQKDLVAGHLEHLEKHLYPLITCGRVLHKDSQWKDFREIGPAKRLNLFNTSGAIIQNSSVLTSGFGISLANFGMNRAALDRLCRFTQMYYDQPGPFPDMGEERHPYGYGKVLSLCAWCARVTMFMLPAGHLNAVIYGPEGCNPYSDCQCGSDTSPEDLSSIKEKMAKKPLDLDFFDSSRDYNAYFL